MTGGAYLEVFLYAEYTSYEGSYCGYTYAKAHLHLVPGSPWATLYAYLYDGGGGAGRDYYTTTSGLYLTYAEAYGLFRLPGGTYYASCGTGRIWV